MRPIGRLVIENTLITQTAGNCDVYDVSSFLLRKRCKGDGKYIDWFIKDGLFYENENQMQKFSLNVLE